MFKTYSDTTLIRQRALRIVLFFLIICEKDSSYSTKKGLRSCLDEK